MVHIEEIRQRIGLKEDDASRDKAIEAMSPETKLRHLCGWHLGDPAWAHTFLGWAEDCGYKITAPQRKD